ncbi:unnamed protein product [Linum trigynum]|uniref:E3 ubiquitin-protein ligase RNF14 n=1 Tax=Linum trigynum TaxID=586398 RepID=A0AAV2FMA8_9ROSI
MPSGACKISSLDSSRISSISPKLPPPRRKTPKKSSVDTCQPVDVHHGVAEAGPSNSPSSGESPAEKEKLLETDNRVSESKYEICDGSGGGGAVDVMSVLEELALAAAEEELELSADQIRVNDQLQENELLAMESIYGENVIIRDRQRGLRTFQIHIEPKIHDELTIATKLCTTSNKMEMASTSSLDEFSYSFGVQFLPPIVLTCSFPASYPSHKPPRFTISVQWLDSLKISSLCSVLDSIWMELQGQEVMYQWIDWLQSSSLSYLGIHQQIILGPYGIKAIGDRRAVSESISPDSDIPLLMRYNDEQVRESFLNNLHECCICFSEHPGIDFVRLPCQHFFCRSCIGTYSDLHVSEGTVNKLLCPESKCGGMIPPSTMKHFLGDDKYVRYESLMLQKTLDCMSDAVYCPRCEFVCIEDEDHFAQCSKCFFSFCSLCKSARHVGEPCISPESKLQLLEASLVSASRITGAQRRLELENKINDIIRELENRINEIMSEMEVARVCKICPHCKMAISKIDGCNKMVCGSCGKYFCYLCNKPINGYEHFRGGACKLFQTVSPDQWQERTNGRRAVSRLRSELNQERTNGRQALRRLRSELNLGRGHKCPLCSQENVKTDNNNHVFCWACQTHYCYLCRKVVKRSSEHFGPKKCKQHTAG